MLRLRLQQVKEQRLLDSKVKSKIATLPLPLVKQLSMDKMRLYHLHQKVHNLWLMDKFNKVTAYQYMMLVVNFKEPIVFNRMGILASNQHLISMVHQLLQLFV